MAPTSTSGVRLAQAQRERLRSALQRGIEQRRHRRREQEAAQHEDVDAALAAVQDQIRWALSSTAPALTRERASQLHEAASSLRRALAALLADGQAAVGELAEHAAPFDLLPSASPLTRVGQEAGPALGRLGVVTVQELTERLADSTRWATQERPKGRPRKDDRLQLVFRLLPVWLAFTGARPTHGGASVARRAASGIERKRSPWEEFVAAAFEAAFGTDSGSERYARQVQRVAQAVRGS